MLALGAGHFPQIDPNEIAISPAWIQNDATPLVRIHDAATRM